MSTLSSLRRVLDEYAVPLRVWLAPGARVLAADVLIDTLGARADVQTDPLSCAHQLQGPAVLVLSANDLRKPDRQPLIELADKARPGRVVLVGGTSDRDMLMEAINTWRAFRVVESTAPKAELVDAVRDAGEALRKEVALGTAIDDLDIENTMLDSAIGQMRDGQDRALRSERQSAVSAMAAGLARTFAAEQAALEGLHDQGINVVQDALDGVRSLTHLLEQLHDHAIDRQAGMPSTPEPVDEVVQLAAGLAGLGPGAPVDVATSSSAQATIDPYALTHLLIRLMRSARTAAPDNATVTVSSTMDDGQVIITVSDPGGGLNPNDWDSDESGHWAASIKTINTAGGTISPHQSADGPASIEVRFPASDES